jgi:hypothetical protein
MDHEEGRHPTIAMGMVLQQDVDRLVPEMADAVMKDHLEYRC